MSLIDEMKNVVSGGAYTDNLLNEANDLISQGKYDDALERLNKCIDLIPDWAVPYRRRAWIYAVNNYLDEALNNINKCLRILSSANNISNDSFVVSYYVLGEVYFRKNDFKNAIEAFNKCLELKTSNVTIADDSDYSTVYHLGVCHLEMLDYSTAHDYLVKAVALKPDNPMIYWSIGNVCLALTSYIRAIDYYSKAINLAPNWNFSYPIIGLPDNDETRHGFLYSCLVNKSVAYGNIDDDDNCLKCNEEAYSIYQNEPTAPINIASLYAKKGNKEKVLRFLEEGIPLINPGHNKNLMSSLLYFEFGEYRDKVLSLLRKQNKISQDEYEQHMKMLQEKKISAVEPSEPSYKINIERLTMGNETTRNIKVTGIYAEDTHGPSVGIMQGGTVNFDSAHSVEDYVSELKKLKAEIEKAKNNKSLDEESAIKTESHVTDAITQSCETKPDKGIVLRSLDKAAEVLNSVKKVAEAAEPIVKLVGAAAVWAAKYL
jgi:tetratricopeptide (TPR) repeat protein